MNMEEVWRIYKRMEFWRLNRASVPPQRVQSPTGASGIMQIMRRRREGE